MTRRRGRPHPVPRPFLKWVGGKGQIVRHLSPHIPSDIGTYHEPFVGGGALFFHSKPERAVLSDGNLRLVRAYRGVRDRVEDVIGILQDIPNDKEVFLEMRAQPIDEADDDAEVAAWLLYLNKTAFNGLYRVNSKNIYNVPFGGYRNPTICDVENLRACSALLQGVETHHEDFELVLDRARPGDFVYFDPPYIPLSETSSFTSYTSGGFDLEDQIRLRDAAWTLRQDGVNVLLSNSSAPLVYDLYAPEHGFEHAEIGVPRAINSKGEGRGKVTELVIW